MASRTRRAPWLALFSYTSRRSVRSFWPALVSRLWGTMKMAADRVLVSKSQANACISLMPRCRRGVAR
jgi:hypothetical protein